MLLTMSQESRLQCTKYLSWLCRQKKLGIWDIIYDSKSRHLPFFSLYETQL